MSASGVNRVTLLGNLGVDPELKYLDDGKAIAYFSLATTHVHHDTEKTTWHHVVCFGRVAELCAEYLKKGSAVYIEGRINYRRWEKDGERKEKAEVIADVVKFLDRRTRRGAPEGAE